MLLDPHACYRAVKSRDARFDGRFFTAVLTTGIYCRPICPARTPHLRNVRFYACAAAAEEAGFRPCRRCRPEAAPGSPAWIGPAATVSRALRLIDEGALDEGSVDALAERLGVGERQLRRLFLSHLGAAPASIARSRRAHRALELLRQTALPISEIAPAAGFRSLRQFNDVFREVFRRTPSQARGGAQPGAACQLRLPFRPPLDWQAALRFLAARAIPGVERVESDCYQRTFLLDGRAGVMEVRATPSGALTLTLSGASAAATLEAARRVRRLFDLDADPLAIGEVLRRSPALARSISRNPGLRVPGAFDPFETLVRAILGQQVSVAAATTLSGRLVQAFGTPLPAASGTLTHTFPLPGALAGADLTGLGLPRARAAAVSQAAAAVASGALTLAPGASLEAFIDRLCELPGVGFWTAHYLAMRALGEPDAFPAGDLVLRRAASSGAPLSERALLLASQAWRPFRAYAALHLWTSVTAAAPAGPRAAARSSRTAGAPPVRSLPA